MLRRIFIATSKSRSLLVRASATASKSGKKETFKSFIETFYAIVFFT